MHVQTLAQKCQIRSAAIGLRRGESALAPAGKGDAKTNAPDSGGPCRKAQAPATGQQRAPGFYSRQSARRLNGKLSPSASRPVVVILSLPTSIILPLALLAGASGSLVLLHHKFCRWFRGKRR